MFMNILVTLNAGYIHPLRVMLASLVHANRKEVLDLYILHSSLTDEDLQRIQEGFENLMNIHPILIDDTMLSEAPITDRYPREMYYRIFAARYLPIELSRVLYLDPDLVVIGSLRELYHTDLSGYYFAAASHVNETLRKINQVRLNIKEEGPYINSGVMLMNLSMLREHQNSRAVFDYIREHKNLLFLPDQDVISALYPSSILLIDPIRYNMTERIYRVRAVLEPSLTPAWVEENCSIIHYCGRNKPWKENYMGKLDCFYHQALGQLKALSAESCLQENLPYLDKTH